MVTFGYLERHKHFLIDKYIIRHQKALGPISLRDAERILDETISIEDLDSKQPRIKVGQDSCSYTLVEHLDTLHNQLRDDIFPLFHATEGGAPFTILRNIMCYCDYLARIIYGFAGNSGSMGNTDEMFKNFGSYEYIKRLYNKYKKYLVQLYRHDLVHTTQPRLKLMFTIKDDSIGLSVSGWHIRSTLREEGSKKENNEKRSKVEGDFEKLKALFEKESNRDGLIHLRLDPKLKCPVINTYCLFFDLINFIERFKHEVKNDASLTEKALRNLLEIEIDSLLKLLNKDIPSFNLDDEENKRIYQP